MDKLLAKLTSRKLWMAIAAVLGFIGAGSFQIISGDTAAFCAMISACIYIFAEAYTDGASLKANTTSKNINANTSNSEIVERISGTAPQITDLKVGGSE